VGQGEGSLLGKSNGVFGGFKESWFANRMAYVTGSKLADATELLRKSWLANPMAYPTVSKLADATEQ
jgi:hypothetical protein